MGTTTYFYKGKTADQTQGLTEIYPSVTPKMVLIIGHGIGERNSGDLNGCKLSSGWGGWANIKLAADVYGIIQIYINTSNNYENGEYQFALAWAKKKYSALGLNNKIWVLGHSLGSYGAGRYAFADNTFASQIAGWIMSASGNFLSYVDDHSPTTWQILNNNGVKIWGVTAENDTCKGTTPTVITTMYSAIKGLNANAHVIKSVFPDTEWDCATSHNAVLSRITQRPMYYSGGNFKLITTGLLTANNIQMNIYQWMLSNPRTSNYQDPTSAYTGPTYPVSPDTTVEIKDYNINPGVNAAVLITYKDNTNQTIKAASGDSITNIYIRKNSSNQFLITIAFAIAPAITKGPYKA